MPGVVAVHQRLPIGDVIDDLLLVASCSAHDPDVIGLFDIREADTRPPTRLEYSTHG
jgi:hypothetical protein